MVFSLLRSDVDQRGLECSSLSSSETNPQRELAKAPLVVVATGSESAETTLESGDHGLGRGWATVKQEGGIGIHVVMVEEVEALRTEGYTDALGDLEMLLQ